MDIIDQVGPKWIEILKWIEMDQIGPNWLEIRKWIERTEILR